MASIESRTEHFDQYEQFVPLRVAKNKKIIVCEGQFGDAIEHILVLPHRESARNTVAIVRKENSDTVMDFRTLLKFEHVINDDPQSRVAKFGLQFADLAETIAFATLDANDAALAIISRGGIIENFESNDKNVAMTGRPFHLSNMHESNDPYSQTGKELPSNAWFQFGERIIRVNASLDSITLEMYKGFPVFDYADRDEKQIALRQVIQTITFPNEERRQVSSEDALHEYLSKEPVDATMTDKQLKYKFQDLRNFIQNLGFSTSIRAHVPHAIH